MTGRRVLVHVGTPKTGTSFVQDRLFHHREALAEQGVLYPADRFDAHFLAALDLMEMQWGGLEKQAVGAWDALAARVRDWPGTVIISHEILAAASAQQVRRALDSFGDAEVHVVLSARDLVRQVPAEWQENVKHRRTIGYAAFLEKLRDPQRRGTLAAWFWAVQEIPDILDRWGGTLPPEQVHLVTVPKPGASPDLLWKRFATALDLDPALLTGGNRSNPSLGVAESALVRRVNERVNHGVLPNDDYRRLVRELLVHRGLSRRPRSARLALREEDRAWAASVSERWVQALSGRGYDVIGDLEDLLADAEAAPFVDPDRPDERQVADVAVEAIAALLGEAARLRTVEEELRAELAATREALEAGGVVRRTKRRLVRAAEHHRLAAIGLAIYRRVRGSSSRSA